jgi:hypothetical protein
LPRNSKLVARERIRGIGRRVTAQDQDALTILTADDPDEPSAVSGSPGGATATRAPKPSLIRPDPV